jgi:hypothetical protein
VSTNLNKKYSFEEFKLYYESTEKVTERRLSLNKRNYLVCITTILMIFGICNLFVDKEYGYCLIGAISILLISTAACLFCFLWAKQIVDFKMLNQAKFAILNDMATSLSFSNGEEAKSYEPFKKEWDKLKGLNALYNDTDHSIIALKSSNIEYYIPKVFSGIFAIMILLSLIYLVIITNSYLQGTENILKTLIFE